MSLSRSFKSKHQTKNPSSQHGFTMPVVALFVLAFLIAPLGFWLSNYKSFASKQVQGASSVNLNDGLYVKVISTKGSWEMLQYLCKTKADCISRLTDGKKWESLSGGITDGSSKHLSYTEAMAEYTYVKVFVKPGMTAGVKDLYTVTTENAGSAVEVAEIDNVRTVLIPVDVLKSAAFIQIVFSDAP